MRYGDPIEPSRRFFVVKLGNQVTANSRILAFLPST